MNPKYAEGYSRRDIYCATCKEIAIRSEKYDAYYCSKCNEWLEGTCSDVTCNFCSKRPEKPNDI